jgi:hypothetical protein
MEHRQRAPGLPLVATVLVILMAVPNGCARMPGSHDTYVRATVGDVPVRVFPGPLDHRASLERVDGYFAIQGFHLLGPQTEELLSIRFPDPRQGGRWRLRSAGRGAWAAYFIREIPTDHIESYHTDESHGGTVVVTRFDSTRRIAEGTFEFDAVLARRRGPRRSPDTLSVRQGSFRVRYDVAPANAYDDSGRD